MNRAPNTPLSYELWKRFNLNGAIHVHSLQKMAQTVLALQNLKSVNNTGVAMLGTGGGIGVEGSRYLQSYRLDLTGSFPGSSEESPGVPGT